MAEVIIILALAAIASATVSIEIGAAFAYFVALTLYFEIVFLLVLELRPGLRHGARFAFRSFRDWRRRIDERRAFERNLYRALWR